jgi:hypothetical protein
MALFQKGDRPAIVWDPQKDKEACRFTEPSMEVSDPFLAQLLVNAGYEFQGEIPVLQDEDEGEPENVPEELATPQKPPRARGAKAVTTK